MLAAVRMNTINTDNNDERTETEGFAKFECMVEGGDAEGKKEVNFLLGGKEQVCSICIAQVSSALTIYSSYLLCLYLNPGCCALLPATFRSNYPTRLANSQSGCTAQFITYSITNH